MRNYYLILTLTYFCQVCFAQQQVKNTVAKRPQSKEWNFNNLNGWKYEHQDNNPDNQCVLGNGYLQIFTRANSVDRKKVCTVDQIYTTGRYTWRTHIPQMGKGDQCSVGSWIYHNDQHELDFEVGYGKDSVRQTLNATPDEMVAYMTSQAYPLSSVPVVIKTGWHLFEIDLTLKNGNYYITWLIDNEPKYELQLEFGKEIAFRLFCSVENLKFIGDRPAQQDNSGLFDFVKYEYHD
ncbi:hypothetical protein [Bacteroides sp.]|uniref:hypothetical protein n=1 Tax=Bacteroides sp. TaxID=29523 RepID=UPI002FC8F9D9